MPHTSDNDKKHAIITQNAHKNEQEQKIFSKVNVHTLKDRSPLIPSYINNYVDVLLHFKGKTLKIHFMFTSIFYNSDNIFG